MQGKSLLQFLDKEEKTNHSALYGYWGGGINITDGRYTYFHYPDNIKRTDSFQYTLMPTHLRQFFTINELKSAELQKPFSFTKGMPVLKIRNDEEGPAIGNEFGAGAMKFEDKKNALYDLFNDPGQLNPIEQPEIIKQMKSIMLDKMQKNDAPTEILERFNKN